jgi:hypothetical protein
MGVLTGPVGEFVLASGKTKALVTLKRSDVRVVADLDILSVRAS